MFANSQARGRLRQTLRLAHRLDAIAEDILDAIDQLIANLVTLGFCNIAVRQLGVRRA
jgi:hypothetical protein